MNSFADSVTKAELGNTYLFSVGQAGFIIKSRSGQLLGIDLYLSNCVETLEGHVGFKRLLPQILSPEELTFQVLMTTHPHYDHFDLDAVPLLMKNGQTKLYASTNCKELVQKTHMEETNISYVAPNDDAVCGDFSLHFVKCDHGKAAPDAFGVIITVDEIKIYVAGDTCLHLDWVGELTKKGPIDIMMAPINGAYGNLNEEECASLAKVLKPSVTVPCHYGMFASHGGSVLKFMEAMGNENPYYLMTQGEKIVLSRDTNMKGLKINHE